MDLTSVLIHLTGNKGEIFNEGLNGWVGEGSVHVSAPGGTGLVAVLTAFMRPKTDGKVITLLEVQPSGGTASQVLDDSTWASVSKSFSNGLNVKARMPKKRTRAGLPVTISYKTVPLDLSDATLRQVNFKGKGATKKMKTEETGTESSNNNYTDSGRGDGKSGDSKNGEDEREMHDLIEQLKVHELDPSSVEHACVSSFSKGLLQRSFKAKSLEHARWIVSKMIQASKATCKVGWGNQNGTGSLFNCAGQFYVLTSFHVFLTPIEQNGSLPKPNDVVERATKAIIKPEFGKWSFIVDGVAEFSPFSPSKVDTSCLDFCCLKGIPKLTSDEPLPSVQLGTSILTKGQIVQLYHHPRDSPMEFLCGNVTTEKITSRTFLVENNARLTSQGSSGAPYFDKDWTIVGIHREYGKFVNIFHVTQKLSQIQFPVPASGEAIFHLYLGEKELGVLSCQCNGKSNVAVLRGASEVSHVDLRPYLFKKNNGESVPSHLDKITLLSDVVVEKSGIKFVFFELMKK